MSCMVPESQCDIRHFIVPEQKLNIVGQLHIGDYLTVGCCLLRLLLIMVIDHNELLKQFKYMAYPTPNDIGRTLSIPP